MSRKGFIAYGFVAAAVALFTARYSLTAADTLYRYAGGITAVGAAAWITSTFAPIILSVVVFVITPWTNFRWLPHLLFIPVAVILFREGSSLYYNEVGVSGDGMVEEFALLTGSGYLVLTLLVHSIALATSSATAIMRRAQGN